MKNRPSFLLITIAFNLLCGTLAGQEQAKYTGILDWKELSPGTFSPTEYGDFAYVLLESDLTGLQLQSNLGIIYRDDTSRAGQIVFKVHAMKQMLTVTRQDYAPLKLPSVKLTATPPGNVLHLEIKSNTIPIDPTDPPQVVLQYRRTPNDAWLIAMLDGAPLPLTFESLTGSFIAKQGEHSLLVQTPAGTFDQQIVCIEGERTNIEVVLDTTRKNPAFPTRHAMVINSDPPGADIVLNGVLVGKSPQSLADLAAGHYEMELRKEGYESHVETISLEHIDQSADSFGGMILLQISAALERKAGYFSLHSDPEKCRFRITPAADSSSAQSDSGLAPRDSLQLSIGTYRIQVEADKYEPFDTTVTISTNQLTQINLVLSLKLGFLAVAQQDSGVMVFYGDSLWGRAPFVSGVLVPGEYFLRLRKMSKGETSLVAKIEPADTFRLEAPAWTLKPGSLVLSSGDKLSFGAEIMDGPDFIGKTMMIIAGSPFEQKNAPVGRYIIQSRRQHFVPQFDTVYVRERTPCKKAITLARGVGELHLKTDPMSPNSTVSIVGDVFRKDDVTDAQGELTLKAVPADFYRIKGKGKPIGGFVQDNILVKDGLTTEVVLIPRK